MVSTMPPKIKRIFKSREHQKCFFCEFNTCSAKLFQEHLINEHCDMIFRCNICNVYLPRLQLMSHMTDHAYKSAVVSTLSQGELPIDHNIKYKCDKCKKDFQSISGIKYHMNAKHVQLQQFECVECKLKFASKRVLQNHSRSLHNSDLRTYACVDCGKTFKTDSTLYTHRKLHLQSRPYLCPYQCKKSFRLKHHLTAHVVTHGTNLPYECKTCHKHFAAMDNLRKHQKIHDQTLSDFICHICGGKMRQKRYLRQHMRKVHLQRA